MLQLPPSLALSSEKLDQDAVLLLETGEDAIIWVGRGAAQEALASLFGVKSFEELASGPVRAQDYLGFLGIVFRRAGTCPGLSRICGRGGKGGFVCVGAGTCPGLPRICGRGGKEGFVLGLGRARPH